MKKTIFFNGEITLEYPEDFWREEEFSLLQAMDRVIRRRVEMTAINHECIPTNTEINFYIDEA